MNAWINEWVNEQFLSLLTYTGPHVHFLGPLFCSELKPFKMDSVCGDREGGYYKSVILISSLIWFCGHYFSRLHNCILTISSKQAISTEMMFFFLTLFCDCIYMYIVLGVMNAYVHAWIGGAGHAWQACVWRPTDNLGCQSFAFPLV